MKVELTDRPIPFVTDMIHAIDDDLKTQTRRPIAGLKELHPAFHGGFAEGRLCGDFGRGYEWKNCRYGKVGHTLWVKEGHWVRPERTEKDMREGADTWPPVYYDADMGSGRDWCREHGWKHVGAMLMKKIYARKRLYIEGLKVERLQDITDADIKAEGVEADSFAAMGIREDYRTPYRRLLGKVYGPKFWDSNPFVWAIQFSKVKP